VLRFSYVSEAWTFTDDGSYRKESTDAKRFTYLLGEGHRSRTAIQQFEKLRDSSLTLKDLTKAFSVDAVSDMFFDGYKKQYEDIIQYITGKRMVKVANKWEEQIKNEPCEEIMQEFAHFQNPEKAVRDYVKKLMGRLVFLQFLQKKGWLGVPAGAEWGTGDTEFIQTLFAQTTDKDHFIDNVLEALFDDLNSEEEKKLPQYRTPYLNGGLFERDDTDETEFPLPAKYMQSLLDFFASYNFTIDENDPDDAEVGVDPEMLGRIFENLLEDNKDKGAFYTPKEIVSYMCRESLIAYLQTGIKDETTKDAIRQFVTTHDVNVLGSNDKFRQQVDEALKNVKICDPAIGSGAFPMGLLKELFQCRTALEGISQHQAAEIKKHIIQQNIYGVDIERGAVDIARLRFWLSLIVDEETPQALPNLDFKIMQGNSLLEQYKGVDLSTMTEKKADESGMLSIFDSMLDVYRLDLRKMLAQYYDCTDHHEKQNLRTKIIDNVKQQLREQSINVDFGDLDLSGNNQFMLWHTWFYDVFSQGGFDIVIGNPPYVEFKTLDEQVKKSLSDYKTTKGKYDLYIPFIEQGLKLTTEKAILIYICPTRFMKRDYGTSLRDYIKKYSKLVQLVDFTDHQVFDNAITYTGV
jgi:type I restriction-modification system DNA methylase subunit